MTALRGTASSAMRTAVCKDCAREIETLRRSIVKARGEGDHERAGQLEKQLSEKETLTTFSYTETSAANVINRGGSRSDRCPEHRRKHRTNTQGMAVAYVDLETIGEAVDARGPQGPSGPLGGLGPMPVSHEEDKRTADLSTYEFGMNDRDIVEILELLRHKRVLVLKAGTGTGKSTFGPYRLMDPPSMQDLERLGILDDLQRNGIERRDGSDNLKDRFTLPDTGPFRLTELGQIIVTEPRVAAATGVSRFVGEKLAMGCTLKQCNVHGTFNPKAHPDGPDGIRGPSCPDIDHDDESQRCTREHVRSHPWPKNSKCVVSDCSSHVGPGYPVGYQVSGDRNHDENCQLVFVTDGTMINWLREGRLSRIGTVIVDEAHERSTNIDFIMGFLRRDLEKYPHLRVIITSATFDPKFYEAFFGGPDVVAVKEVPAVKTVGYGMPLFPDLDSRTPEISAYIAESTEANPKRWPEESAWPLVDETEPDTERFIRAHWPIVDKDGQPLTGSDGARLEYAKAPKLRENEVLDPKDAEEEGENLWETTRALMPLRFGQIAEEQIIAPERWKEEMPTVLADFIIRLTKGLDEAGIFGDILSFLPTERTINDACERIESEVGSVADVCPLVSKLSEQQIDRALSARRKGDPRKIVVSTNLAETSLTVEGVRFVVDTGLIAQSEWDAKLAKGQVGTKRHSKAGIKQRWGRVGRKAPGWVFPLYTKAQYAALDEDTPPGSARENLEALMMTARMGGIDDIKTFPWPAAFPPEDDDQFAHIELDKSARDAREAFVAERDRADAALRSNGAVDDAGHPTTFGKELSRFSGLGSTASAMSIMYADRLGCVPEVATILALLENARLVGPEGLFQGSYDWPDEWRVEAAGRHRGLASLAEDDAHLVLLVTAAWERADPGTKPWKDSPLRREWAREWWINNDVLFQAALNRQKVLEGLSPAMKEEVKRFVEPTLLDRARGVLARTLKTFEFAPSPDGGYVPARPSAAADSPEASSTDCYLLESNALVDIARTDATGSAQHVIALRRRKAWADLAISSLITVPTAAELTSDSGNPASSVADAIAMVLAFRRHASPDPKRDIALAVIQDWPVGKRIKLRSSDDGRAGPGEVETAIDSFARPRTDAEARADGIAVRKKGRKRVRRSRAGDEDAPDATENDASGELRDYGLDEDEKKAAQERTALDVSIGQDGGCGECEACRKGRRCTDPPAEEAGRAFDAIRGRKAGRHQEVVAAIAAAEFEIVGGDRTAGWFEITGYDVAAGGKVTVKLSADWRAEDAHPDPARHGDVHAGQEIGVTVGEWVADHDGPLLAFNRADGQGRFLLREAPASFKTQLKRNQIAVSLSSGAQGLLEQLAKHPGQAFKATVFPARAEGCFTITLLEVLYQHLRQAQRNLPQVPTDPAADPAERGTSMVPAYPAFVAEEPNDNGWMLFRLSHHDSKRGLYHLVTHKPDARDAANEADDSAGNVGVQRISGFPQNTSWQLRLTQANASLAVGGRDLDELERITRESNHQIRLFTPGGKQASNPETDRDQDAYDDADVVLVATSSDDDDEEAPTVRPAPPKMQLATKSDHPLSPVLAEDLANLDESAEWQNEVWTFWARTHHIKIEPFNGVRAGTDTTEADVEFVAQDRTAETPVEMARAEVARMQTDDALGTQMPGTVSGVTEKSVFVKLDTGLEVLIPGGEVSWSPGGQLSDHVQRGERVDVKITAVDPDSREAGSVKGSIRACQPDPLVEFEREHPIGHEVTGLISILEEDAAWVALGPDVRGRIYVRDIAHVAPEKPSDLLSPEQHVTARITGYQLQNHRRCVDLSIKATLPEPYVAYKARHKIGDRVEATVDRVSRTHVNVRHSNGAPGVVHVRNLRWVRVEDATELYSEGDRITAEILKFDDDARQLELSIKATRPEPYVEYKARHSVGDRVEATVDRVSRSHVNVQHSNGASGVIHVSNLRWIRVEDATDLYSKGDRIKAEILKFDDDNRQLELSIKKTLPQPFDAFAQRYPRGSVVDGQVVSMKEFGAFVRLPGDAEGMIHVGQFGVYRLTHPREVVSEKQWISVEVLSCDVEKRKISLRYLGPASAPTASAASSAKAGRPAQPRPVAPTPAVRPAPVPPQAQPAPRPPAPVRPPVPVSAPRRVPRTATAFGESVEQATERAAASLGLRPSQVRSRTLQEAKRGMFNRLRQPAQVEVTERL